MAAYRTPIDTYDDGTRHRITSVVGETGRKYGIMRIGINALYWLPDSMGGTQTYFLNLVKNLVQRSPDYQFYLFINATAATSYSIDAGNLTVVPCQISGHNRMMRLAWENSILPRLARRYRLDLMHSLGYLSPPLLPVPTVVTVLDMIHFTRPADIALSKQLMWRLLFPASLARASQVITISRSVRDELVGHYPWAAKKIRPIHLGVDHDLFSAKTVSTRELSLSRPFVLAVASLSRHKNLGAVIKAFSLAAVQVPELRLLLVGMRSNAAEELYCLAEESGLNDRIEFTGRVSDSELVLLYQNATAFIYPSLYEGFGLPVLEAMACGCPVIASNRFSVPEIAGDAALLVDPCDTLQIAGSIVMLANMPELRNSLAQKGLEQARKYDWARTAEETLSVYRHVTTIAP